MKGKKLILLLILLILLSNILCSCNKESDVNFDNSLFSLADNQEYYGTAFGQGNVIDVFIDITEENWQDILENPLDEEFHSANIIFNGNKLNNIAFRTKGNSSLKDIAQTDSERYGFKVKTDKYIENQTILGLNEFVLNASYADPSYMREYLTYEAMSEIGGIVPNVAYCNLYINDELFGFYLCIESYDDSFVERLTQDKNACLYKAENDCNLTINDDGSGFDCQYGNDENNQNIKNLITILNNTISENKEELENILDINSVLKGIAINFVMGNYDSYNGQIAHNYYLLYENKKFQYIGWDYNMSFGAFPGDNGQSAGVDISCPIMLTTEAERPLISKLLSIDEYYDIYISYVKHMVEFLSDFENDVQAKANSIAKYVENDPTAFFTFEEFQENIIFSEYIETTNQTIIEPRIPAKGEMPTKDGEITEQNGIPIQGDNPPIQGDNPPIQGDNPPIQGDNPPIQGGISNQFPPNGNSPNGNYKKQISIVNYMLTKIDYISQELNK